MHHLRSLLTASSPSSSTSSIFSRWCGRTREKKKNSSAAHSLTLQQQQQQHHQFRTLQVRIPIALSLSPSFPSQFLVYISIEVEALHCSDYLWKFRWCVVVERVDEVGKVGKRRKKRKKKKKRMKEKTTRARRLVLLLLLLPIQPNVLLVILLQCVRFRFCCCWCCCRVSAMLNKRSKKKNFSQC